MKKFRDRKDKEYFARNVTKDEIIENDYNLSVSTYVEKEDTREKIDIVKLNKELEETVKRIDELRNSIDRIIKELETEDRKSVGKIKNKKETVKKKNGDKNEK